MSNRHFSFHLFSHTENHTADSAVSGRHKNKAGALYGRLRRAAGFTLAELLVVIAIIGILAGFGFVAVIRYRKTLKQEELDATAREIFVAAQNHATVAKASGSWDHYVLNAAAGSDAETLLGAAMGATGAESAAPADYTDDAVKQYGAWGGLDWLKLSLSSDHKSWATDHAFRAIRVNPEGRDNSANSIISLLLPLQSIDETLRGNGNIIIEYDAVTASVYSVWYSKDGAIGDEQYTNDNRKNKEERLKLDYDKMVGYYGGGVSEQDDPDVKELQPIAVTVSNNDELTLNIVNPNQDTTAAEGKTARSYTISAVVTGETSGAVKNVSQGTVVSNRVGDSSGNPVIVQSSTNKTFYTCVLDNVNVNGGHFAELFSGTDSNGNAFIPGEDLSIKVTVSDSSNPALAQSATVHTNSLFASISGSATDTTAAISYARHLENLGSDVSKVNQSSTVISKFAVKKAVLNNDIDWAHSFIDSSNSSGAVTMGEGGVLSTSDSITGKNGKSIQILYKKEKADFDSSKAESSIPKAGQAGCYYGIQNSLLKNATKTVSKSEVEKNLDPLQTIDGNGHSIKNLKIQPDKAESDAGLISRYGISKQASKAATSSLTIQNVTLKDPSIDASGRDKKGDNYYGFFIGQAYQTKVTISNCKVDFTDSGLVNGGSRVSSFVANSSGSELTLQNLTLQSGKDLTIGNPDKQTSVQHAGGFAGYSASQKITIQNCRIQAGGDLTVAGEKNAGGFVGGTTSDNENLTIQSSHITAGGNLNATGSDYAGGIVGYTQAKTLSYKSSSIEVGGNATVTGKGAALGIGFSRHPDGKKLEEVTASNITISVKGATVVKDKGDSEERKEDQPYGLGVLFGGIGNGDSDTAAADIKDIRLDMKGNVSIAASGNAKAHVSTGVLVGDATNVNLTVTNSPLDLQSKTLTVSNRTTSSDRNGTGDAGGMIGRTAGGSLSISGSGVQANDIEIDAGGDAGGLIGYSKGTELTVRDSNVTAVETLHVETPTGTAKFTNAGGIVGHANATSKATFNEDTVCAKIIEIKGVMAGGMAGKLAADGKTENTGLILNNNVVTASSKLSVTAQSVSGSNDENNKATDSGFAGGLAGATYGQADIENCYVFGGGKEDIVSGESWVGGLIGYCIGRYKNDSEGLNDHKVQQKIIIRNCAASTYVELTNAQLGRDAAGGLIGLVNCPKAGSEISNCYAGGRTRNGSYGTETDENTQGRFNVKVKVKAGNKDGAFAAGFIGRIFQTERSGLTISSCYTTASVYNSTEGAEGKAGSFIGQIEGKASQALKIEQCYTTGLVGTAKSTNEIDISDKGYIGTIGSGCEVSGSSNYYLKGVQAVSGSGDSAKTETQPALKKVSSGSASATNLTVEGKEKTDAEDSGNPFAKQGSTNNQSAAVYDSGLTDENQKKAVDFPIKNTGLYSFTYPYKTTGMTASVKYVITGSDGSVSVASNGSYAHIGDWPVPVEDTAEPALRIVNGSKLTALIAVDASSFSGSTELPIGFGVEGVTSGKTAFMQLKVKKETDGAYSVTAESESSTAASGSKAGVDLSEKYKALTNSSSLAVRAYADLKKDFSAEELSGLAAAGDLVNGSDAVSPNAPVSDIEASGVRSRYQYLEIDLDDITTSGGNFASIFTGFIPGEDIRIYVAKDADTFEKVKTAAVGTDDSELTKKKTALKEKKTAYETAAAAAASSSATEAQKTAAATVLEEYQTAANDLFDHYSVVNSLFADGSNKGSGGSSMSKDTAYDPYAYNLLAVRRAEVNQAKIDGTSRDEKLVPASDNQTRTVYEADGSTARPEYPTQYDSTALILNGRHLQNLSTAFSKVDGNNGTSGDSADEATKAIQTQYHRNYLFTKAAIRNDITWKSSQNFLAIVNDQLTSLRGGMLLASETSGAGEATVTAIAHSVISNLAIQPEGEEKNAGLIGLAKADTFEVRNLILADPKLSSGSGSTLQNAGMLIGEISNDKSSSLIRNVVVKGTNKLEVSAEVGTTGNAGGMIGASQSTSLTVTGCTVQVGRSGSHDSGSSDFLQVTGSGNAGGLIGSSSGNTATISGCHVIGGGTPDLIKGGTNAGGMIGYIYCGDGDGSRSADLKVTGCSASVYVRQEGTNSEDSDFAAGGLIGAIRGDSETSITIDHSYAGGRTKDGKYVYDTGTEVQGRFNVQAMGNGENETYVIAGGLVGDISSADGNNVYAVNVSDCYTTASVYCTSDYAAGSFIGSIYSDKVSVHNNYSTGLMQEQELGGDDNESGGNTSSGGNSEKETQGYGFIGDDPNIGSKDENSNYHDNSYLCGVVGIHIDDNGNKTETEPQQLLLISGGSKELDSTKSGEAPFTTGTLDSDNTASIPATAIIYDDSLKSPYPFNVTNAAIVSGTTYGHIGDWPVTGGKSNIGFIYYEKISGDTNTFYYHGYTVPMDSTGEAYKDGANYTEIKTPDGTGSDKGYVLNSSGLVTNKETYVAEDGYLLLVPEGTDLSTLKLSFGDVIDLNQRQSGKQLKDLRKYDMSNMTNASLTGYDAFVIDENTNSSLYLFNSDTKGGVLYLYEEKNYQSVYKGEFTFLPFFADTIKAPLKADEVSSDNSSGSELQNVSKREENDGIDYDYIIRSARQLKLLGVDTSVHYNEPSSEGYLKIQQGLINQGIYRDEVIEQQLDISFDPNKVTFSSYGEPITDKKDATYQSNTIRAIQYEHNDNTTYKSVFRSSLRPGGQDTKDYYVLDGLTQPFVTNIGTYANLEKLHVTNMKATYFISVAADRNYSPSTSSISDITIDSSTFSVDSEGKIHGSLIDTCTNMSVSDCHINDSVIAGSGMIGTNSGGTITDCSMENNRIAGDGFVGQNRGTIENVVLTNNTITGNGFAGNSEGTIKNSFIENAVIGQNGFVSSFGGNSGGTITGCQIYSDEAVYQKLKDRVASEQGTPVYYLPGNNAKGYDLVQIGVTIDDSGNRNITDQPVGGFVGTAQGWGSPMISKCSVTGRIYSTDSAAGFVHSFSTGNPKISECYANTIIDAGTAGGFAYTFYNNNVTLEKSHSLGIIIATGGGAGFIYDNTNTGKIENCYAAIWSTKTGSDTATSTTSTEDTSYYGFTKTATNGTFTNNFYLKEVDGQTGLTDTTVGSTTTTTATGKTYEELKGLSNNSSENNLGVAAAKETTTAYYQYMSESEADAGVYPYPTVSGMMNYGDWRGTGTSGLLVYAEYENGNSALNVFRYLDGSVMPMDVGTTALTVGEKDNCNFAYAIIVPSSLIGKDESKQYESWLQETYTATPQENESSNGNSNSAESISKLNFTSSSLGFSVPGYTVFRITNDDYDFIGSDSSNGANSTQAKRTAVTIKKNDKPFVDINLNFGCAMAPPGKGTTTETNLGSNSSPFQVRTHKQYGNLDQVLGETDSVYQGKYFLLNQTLENSTKIDAAKKNKVQQVEGSESRYLYKYDTTTSSGTTSSSSAKPQAAVDLWTEAEQANVTDDNDMETTNEAS